eukprot:s2653_g11.t1
MCVLEQPREELLSASWLEAKPFLQLQLRTVPGRLVTQFMGMPRDLARWGGPMRCRCYILGHAEAGWAHAGPLQPPGKILRTLGCGDVTRCGMPCCQVQRSHRLWSNLMA